MSTPETHQDIVFSFTVLDDGIANEAEAAFGEDAVSSSKHMTGGESISIFFRPVTELLGKVLDFKSKQGDRIRSAKLLIGKERISLEGYTAEDAERLLNSPGFQQALAQLSKPAP